MKRCKICNEFLEQDEYITNRYFCPINIGLNKRSHYIDTGITTIKRFCKNNIIYSIGFNKSINISTLYRYSDKLDLLYSNIDIEENLLHLTEKELIDKINKLLILK